MNLQILDLINFEMTIIVATSRQEYTLKVSVEILSKIVLLLSYGLKKIIYCILKELSWYQSGSLS